jgi:hypothetical protein
MTMKAHITIMVILAVLAVLLIAFAPSLEVGAGFGLVLLICPLMMLGMMLMMGKDNNHKH